MKRPVFTLLVALTCIVRSVALAAIEPIATIRPSAEDRASIILASASGAILDSNLLKGGGSDDTKALQQLLDRAASGKSIHLIVDGPARVSGLQVYSNTTIECTAGGGFYLMHNSPGAIIRNAHRSRDAVTDERIQIIGCFINGNRNGQVTEGPPDSPWRRSQAPDGTFKSGLQFLGVRYLTLEKITLWNVRSWAAWIANAKVVRLENIVVDSDIPPFPDQSSIAEQRRWRDIHTKNNDDGLHFNGPIQYLTINDVKLRTWDDGIALNANDGSDDVTLKNELGPYVGQGPITDVMITNVTLMDAHHGFRLLSGNQRVDRVLVQNVVGTVRERMAVISRFISPSRGDFGSISFRNVNISCGPHPSWRHLYPERFTKNPGSADSEGGTYDKGEEGDIPLFSINARVETLDLRDVHASTVDERPLIRIGRDALVENLIVNLTVHDPLLRATPVALSGHVKNLKLSLDWDGPSPIKYLGGTIERLRLTRDSANAR